MAVLSTTAVVPAKPNKAPPEPLTELWDTLLACSSVSAPSIWYTAPPSAATLKVNCVLFMTSAPFCSNHHHHNVSA